MSSGIPPSTDQSKTNMDPLSVSVKRACELLGISKTTFYKELKEGAFTAKKKGRSTLVPYDQLRPWLISLPDIEFVKNEFDA